MLEAVLFFVTPYRKDVQMLVLSKLCRFNVCFMYALCMIHVCLHHRNSLENILLHAIYVVMYAYSYLFYNNLFEL